jgi:hypothetical protein
MKSPLQRRRKCSWLGRRWREGSGRGEGGADGLAPGIGTEGVNVFVLGELDGLEEGLAEIGECGSGFGFDLAFGDGREDAAQGGAEVAGGYITVGEERGYLVANLLGGEGLRFPIRMEIAEMRMAGEPRSGAAAAIGESEGTQARAVLGAIGGHGSLQKRRI